MCEILVKAIKTLKSWRVAVVMFLLVAPALGGLFTALGAGQAGGPLGVVGMGCWCIAYISTRRVRRVPVSRAVPM